MDTYLCSGCDRKSWLYQKVRRHGSDVSEMSTSHRYVMSLYFAVVTMTTTGYGDIGAHYGEGFLISIVLIIVGMLIFAYALSVLAATLANRDAPKYIRPICVITRNVGQFHDTEYHETVVV